jgi:DNA invertase Pin-like site-specific DNA recombinase
LSPETSPSRCAISSSKKANPNKTLSPLTIRIHVRCEVGLARPEHFRLLADAHAGDILLVEQVDRISRLTGGDWNAQKARLTEKHIRVVSLDLPTSWIIAANVTEEFTARMFGAINDTLLDLLAAMARKDYEDRRRRQAQGQAKAKAESRYKGRQEDAERNAGIAQMITLRLSWSSIQAATGCSRATISKIAKRLAATPGHI